MQFRDAIISSLQTISNHKFRSFLTLLGIIIGVISVVSMFTSVNAFKKVMEDGMRDMGFDNTITITSGNAGNWSHWGRGFGFRQQTVNRRAKPLTYKDFEALKAEVEVKNIFGMIESWGQTREKKWLRVRATNIDFFDNNSFVLREGRFFNHFEMRNAEKVCIIGPNFARDNMADEPDPIGKFLTIGTMRYQIIGVLDVDPLNSGGMQMFNPWGRNWDLMAVYIPLRTGAVYLRSGMAIDSITLQAHDLESFSYMKDRANQVMLAQHNMAKSFQFTDINNEMLEVTQKLDEIMRKWTVGLIVIASVSLFVGGIGLFSTLLISINERMLEIGIRKSVGAKDRDIFFYFIMEALTLSFIAGFIGTSIALLLTTVLSLAVNMNIPISLLSLNIGFIFALSVGFFSGLYPAIKASKINPIQAIFYFE
jgi:putative ABC transport system permease protein